MRIVTQVSYACMAWFISVFCCFGGFFRLKGPQRHPIIYKFLFLWFNCQWNVLLDYQLIICTFTAVSSQLDLLVGFNCKQMCERQWAQVTVNRQYREHAFCKRRPRLWMAVKSKSFQPRADVFFLALINSANTTEKRPLLVGKKLQDFLGNLSANNLMSLVTVYWLWCCHGNQVLQSIFFRK